MANVVLELNFWVRLYQRCKIVVKGKCLLQGYYYIVIKSYALVYCVLINTHCPSLNFYILKKLVASLTIEWNFSFFFFFDRLLSSCDIIQEVDFTNYIPIS